MVLSYLTVANCCEAFRGIGGWAGSVPRIRVHDVFYPHPHLRDLKASAKRGKILVITLIVSAGLVALISTAIIRGGKEKAGTDINTTETITPAELRACVTAAANAGRQGLVKGEEQALNMAFSAYANERGVEWNNESLKCSPHATCNIGKHRVTVILRNEEKTVEVRALCGNIGASAIANANNDSIQSSIFTSHALDRGLEM